MAPQGGDLFSGADLASLLGAIPGGIYEGLVTGGRIGQTGETLARMGLSNLGYGRGVSPMERVEAGLGGKELVDPRITTNPYLRTLGLGDTPEAFADVPGLKEALGPQPGEATLVAAADKFLPPPGAPSSPSEFRTAPLKVDAQRRLLELGTGIDETMRRVQTWQDPNKRPEHIEKIEFDMPTVMQALEGMGAFSPVTRIRGIHMPLVQKRMGLVNERLQRVRRIEALSKKGEVSPALLGEARRLLTGVPTTTEELIEFLTKETIGGKQVSRAAEEEEGSETALA